MIMTERQALGAVLPKRPKVCAYPLTDGLQGFKPGPLLGRMDAHTLRRVMIYGDKNGHLPLLARERRRHIGAPHRINLRRDDRPIVGLRSMWMPLPRRGQQLVGAHQ